MLGSDIDTAGWPESGEIDAMESLGAAKPGQVHGTLHGPDGSADGWMVGSWHTPTSDPSGAFHRYTVNWWPGIVELAVDDRVYVSVTPADLQAGQRWVFDKPNYLLISLTVGGSWAGPPASSTAFPRTMLIDSVRWRR
jgi:beta-glucanase (GH16 family)